MKAIGVHATRDTFGINTVANQFNPDGWICDPIIIRSPATGYRHLAYEMLNIGSMPKFKAKDLTAMNEHLHIDLSKPAPGGEVDVLIGLDNPDLWIMQEYKKYRNIVAVRTALGWTASLLTDEAGPNRQASKLPSDQEILEAERSMHESYGRYDTSPSSSSEEGHQVNFINTAVEMAPLADRLPIEDFHQEEFDGSGVSQQRNALLARLNEQLAKHWAMEDFPEGNTYTKEEERCFEAMEKSYEVKNGKAYVAPLWKEGQPEKGLNNYPFALAR